jgi:hypothetical protein
MAPTILRGLCDALFIQFGSLMWELVEVIDYPEDKISSVKKTLIVKYILNPIIFIHILCKK